MSSNFNYQEAFLRNLGWVTEAEQARLRRSKVAIAGMGGVGGIHLETLARLGIGRYHIADFDHFELKNMNRQAGAMMSTLHQPKVTVMSKIALDINPEAEITCFETAIDEANVDAFLDGVDVYLDGLELYAIDARQLIFDRCKQKGIPVVTAAPVAMGVAVMCFLPDSMSFEEYFGLKGLPIEEQAFRFILGVTPAALQRHSIVAPEHIDVLRQKLASTSMGCALAAGAAGTEVMKLLLKRGKVLAAPHGYHFDAYTLRYTRTWRPWGHRNPLSKLTLFVARLIMKRGRALEAAKKAATATR